MTIRQTLADAITQSGQSLNTLAKELGIPQPTLTRFLQGTDLRLSAVEKLAEHFGLELGPATTRKPKKKAKSGK